MKKLSIICLCASFLLAQNVFADSNNISVGINPFGILKVSHQLDHETKLKLSYKSTFGFNASYERQFDGVFIGGEVDYMRAVFDKLSNGVTSGAFEFKDVNDVSVYFIAGSTLGYKNRLQAPISFGFGYENMSSSPQNKGYWSVQGKVRCRYFVSNNIAIFGGTRVRWGWSSNDEDIPSDEVFHWDLEAGLVYAF